MNTSPSLQAVVFDFDGTLAELTIDFALMKRKIAATAAAVLEQDVHPDGRPVLEWLDELAALAPSRDLGLELHCRGRLIVTAMELDSAAQGRLFPSTRKVLGQLSRRGLRLGVITRNCTPAVLRVFPDLLEHCQVFLPREEARRLKPHPDHLLHALELLETPPSRALMVGDHPMDVAVGKEAGALSAALGSGHADRQALEKSRPDIFVEDLPGLFASLDKLGLLPPLLGDGQQSRERAGDERP
jgi:phosphoglycolate phosphatase